MKLCAIYTDCDFRAGVVAGVPQAWFDALNLRATQIAVGETLAVLLFMIYFSQRAYGRLRTLFIDNIGVVYSIVEGAAKAADLGSLIHGLHLRMHECSITPWTEHVAS